MTREETLAYALRKKAGLESEINKSNCEYGKWVMYSAELDFTNACVSALKGPTREQVEKVWRGCEYCAGDVNDRPYLDSKEIYIYDDGILMNGYESACKILFCPKCGRPLTDEAVEMVMERREKLYETI